MRPGIRRLGQAARRLAGPTRRAVPALAVLALAGGLASGLASGPTRPERAASMRLYEMTTETGMPHLEENLRYAVVRERRCLDRRNLSSAFWMLKDVSLQDCRLEKAAEQHDSASYVLHCDGGHGTLGAAEWQLGPERIRGTLDVKLGGKNMTFFQRIVAVPVGECAEPR